MGEPRPGPADRLPVGLGEQRAVHDQRGRDLGGPRDKAQARRQGDLGAHGAEGALRHHGGGHDLHLIAHGGPISHVVIQIQREGADPDLHLGVGGVDAIRRAGVIRRRRRRLTGLGAPGELALDHAALIRADRIRHRGGEPEARHLVGGEAAPAGHEAARLEIRAEIRRGAGAAEQRQPAQALRQRDGEGGVIRLGIQRRDLAAIDEDLKDHLALDGAVCLGGIHPQADLGIIDAQRRALEVHGAALPSGAALDHPGQAGGGGGGVHRGRRELDLQGPVARLIHGPDLDRHRAAVWGHRGRGRPGGGAQALLQRDRVHRHQGQGLRQRDRQGHRLGAPGLELPAQGVADDVADLHLPTRGRLGEAGLSGDGLSPRRPGEGEEQRQGGEEVLYAHEGHPAEKSHLSLLEGVIERPH